MNNLIRIIFIAMFLLSLLSCTGEKSIDSKQIVNKEKRIEFVEKQVIAYSDIQDAEYSLFNSEGFESFIDSGVLEIGESKCDFRFAVKTSCSDISKWTKNCELLHEQFDKDWIYELTIQRSEKWKINGLSEYYNCNGTGNEMIIFPNEGLIFKRIYTE